MCNKADAKNGRNRTLLITQGKVASDKVTEHIPRVERWPDLSACQASRGGRRSLLLLLPQASRCLWYFILCVFCVLIRWTYYCVRSWCGDRCDSEALVVTFICENGSSGKILMYLHLFPKVTHHKLSNVEIGSLSRINNLLEVLLPS